MRIKRILWATDGSNEAEEALRWAEFIAGPFGAKIIGLRVLETLNLDKLQVSDDLREEISFIDSDAARREAKRLGRIENILEKKEIRAEMRIVRGVPHQEIVKASQDRAVDLIAMGKRGLTPWGRMLVGSTTASVLHEVHVPVLTVRRAGKRHTVKKILLPTSFSPMETRSLEWGLELTRKFNATLFLLHVIEVHRSYDQVKGGFIGRLRDSASEQLHGLLDTVPSHKQKGVKVMDKVKAFPRAWSGIVSFVKDEGIDMIVMSTHARQKLSRFALGSVAENVIKEAPCPVITVTP